jgi:UTP--glucose-1-phosphate uridylyltransferase
LTSDLRAELARLDPELLADLNRHGFDAERLIAWSAMLDRGPDQNRVAGEVTPPEPGDVLGMPEHDSPAERELGARGTEALAAGELALVVLAGGMATRMGGVVKALVEAADGRTFLDIRLAEREYWSRVADAPLPLWMLTSHATDGPIREALGDRLDGVDVDAFRQYVSLRLTPEKTVFHDADGRPSPHATGHGDLVDAIREHGRLQRFIDAGGRYLWIANLDNLGAGVDPAVLGWHLAHPAPVTVEVVEKVGTDRGGIPVRWDGRPVILEEFRLPQDFDGAAVRVFNTNTLIVDAVAVAELEFDWTYFLVSKEVDGRPAVQFERLIGELTSALDSRFLQVPRSGEHSRFLPVKDSDELERRRAEIARHAAQFLA